LREEEKVDEIHENRAEYGARGVNANEN
jgi:hypothetical protein